MKGRFDKQDLNFFVEDNNKDMVSDEALDLLGRMLVYDKNKRIKVKEALAHKYFDPIRTFIKE